MAKVKKIVGNYTENYLLSNEEKQLTMIWTPKAACATAVRTFFDYVGFQFQNDVWIHNVRGDYENDMHEDHFTVIQFCRNPYTRAISSYLHMLRHNFLNVRTNKLGFTDFMKLVKSVGPNIYQSHTTKQYKNINPDYILKIENINGDLENLKQKTGIDLKLNICDSHSFIKLFNMSENVLDVDPDEFSEKLSDTITNENYDYFDNTQINLDQKIFYKVQYESFYNQKSKDLVSSAYEKDLEFFEYEYPF